MLRLEISHEGLHKYRIIKGETQAIINLRAELQMRTWNDQWARQTAAEARRQEQQARAWAKESKKQIAAERTADAKNALDAIESLLKNSLELDHTIDWSTLKDHSPFPVPQPLEPPPQSPPAEPRLDDPRFSPKLNWFLRLVPPIREKAVAKSKQAFSEAHREWSSARARCEQDNRARSDQFKKLRESWLASKNQWLDDQAKRNAAVEKAENDLSCF